MVLLSSGSSLSSGHSVSVPGTFPGRLVPPVHDRNNGAGYALLDRIGVDDRSTLPAYKCQLGYHRQ